MRNRLFVATWNKKKISILHVLISAALMCMQCSVFLCRTVIKSPNARLKREFMLSQGPNNTSNSQCFQTCNNKWRTDFERVFKMNASDFYDFPFHPLILDYTNYLTYCRISDRQTLCFLEDCGDESSERAFSPANFLCNFKRQQFIRIAKCLDKSEPITFLKCENECHTKISPTSTSTSNETHHGKIFLAKEMDSYTKELDALCTFQDCYKDCYQSIVSKLCEKTLAKEAIDFITVYIKWHSLDLMYWHQASQNLQKFPASCAKISGHVDPQIPSKEKQA